MKRIRKYFIERNAQKIKDAHARGFKWAMYEYCANGMTLREIESYVQLPSFTQDKPHERAFDHGAYDAMRYIENNIEKYITGRTND